MFEGIQGYSNRFKNKSFKGSGTSYNIKRGNLPFGNRSLGHAVVSVNLGYEFPNYSSKRTAVAESKTYVTKEIGSSYMKLSMDPADEALYGSSIPQLKIQPSFNCPGGTQIPGITETNINCFQCSCDGGPSGALVNVNVTTGGGEGTQCRGAYSLSPGHIIKGSPNSRYTYTRANKNNNAYSCTSNVFNNNPNAQACGDNLPNGLNSPCYGPGFAYGSGNGC
jgi:hypothetical protein